jgi:hypothetical protein
MAQTQSPRVGNDSPYHKLNEDLVRQIIECFAAGDSDKEIAFHFHVSKACINNIRRGRTWRHMTQAQTPQTAETNQ